MAFDRDNFSTSNVGQGSAAPKLSTYITTDNKATTIAADYFVGLNGFLTVGDFIFAVTSDASLMLRVSKVDSDEVDTVDIVGTVVPATGITDTLVGATETITITNGIVTAIAEN